MSIQYSVTVNNNRLDSIENTIGTSAKLRIYTGTVPANCAAAATGTMLVEIQLPTDWMANASGASKVKSGTWSGTAVASGVGGYFRITDNAGTVTGIQGTAGMSGTDLILDNSNIATSQSVVVNTFTLNTGNT